MNPIGLGTRAYAAWQNLREAQTAWDALRTELGAEARTQIEAALKDCPTRVDQLAVRFVDFAHKRAPHPEGHGPVDMVWRELAVWAPCPGILVDIDGGVWAEGNAPLQFDAFALPPPSAVGVVWLREIGQHYVRGRTRLPETHPWFMAGPPATTFEEENVERGMEGYFRAALAAKRIALGGAQ